MVSGRILRAAGEHDLAAERLREARDGYERSSSRFGEGSANYELAILARLTGEDAKALTLALRALELYGGTGSDSGVRVALVELARCLKALGDPRARPYARLACALPGEREEEIRELAYASDPDATTKGEPVLLAEGVHAVITDRSGGGSAPPYNSRNLGGAVGDEREHVLANRRQTALELGLDPSRVVFMRQVHSANTAYVVEPFGERSPELDAICTDQPGLGLAALVADCAPVLLADPVAGLVGAAHSGREGTFRGVVPALVEAMAARGAEPARMVALVGPTACGLCYEVSPELREQVAAALPETWSTTLKGTPALDVRAGIAAQLAKAGVGDVRHDDRCTIESAELYSYRRDRVTGRFAAYIWLAP